MPGTCTSVDLAYHVRMRKKSALKSKEAIRSFTMSRIRSKDTSIEITFRKALWRSGIRYRKNYNALPGKPDVAITKHRIAVFCDGEFWHGKDWNSAKDKLQTRRDYWVQKIERNIDRDNAIEKRLARLGWTVLRFWGKDIEKNLDLCIAEVKEAILQAKVDAADAAGYYEPGAFDDGEESVAAERGPGYAG